MAHSRNLLQALRHRACGIGRVLLPALALTLTCPAGAICADTVAASTIAAHDSASHDHGVPTHEHGVPVGDHDSSSTDHGGNHCPHCPTQASAISAARTPCDVAAGDAPPPAKLPHDLHIAALPSTIPSAPAIPHPSPPRTAFSTGSGPPSVPLNLLHCVFLN